MPRQTTKRSRPKYYRISKVVELTGVPDTTLRRWETQYPSLQNILRIKEIRYYTDKDIQTILEIKSSKDDEQGTATEESKDSSRMSREEAPQSLSPSGEQAAPLISDDQEAIGKESRQKLRDVVDELKSIQDDLKSIRKQLDQEST